MAKRLTTNQRMERGAGGRFTGLTWRAKNANTNAALKVETKLKDQHKDVLERMEKNAVYSLRGAMYVVTQMAKSRIVRANRASSPGASPHTKGKAGKNLKGAIRYFFDKDKPEAIIGPSAEFVSDVGALHEFGGDRPSTPKRENYPKRPFMGPALEESLDRFVGQFKSSLVS